MYKRQVDETEIPASQILPTHINRNEMLFGKSIEYALKGGAVDFTGNEDIDYWETICDEAVSYTHLDVYKRQIRWVFSILWRMETV